MAKKVHKQILNENEQNQLIKAVECLNTGGILLYPTDTTWGLGCDATNEDAVDKLYQLKKRDTNKPMLILLEDERKINRYVEEIPEVAWDIIDSAVNPITIIYPNGKNISSNLKSKDNSIGIRLVKTEFLIQVLRKFKKPLVSTSANLSGEEVPADFGNINKELINKVDYIVDIKGGKNSKPSSIIKIGLHGDVKILRK